MLDVASPGPWQRLAWGLATICAFGTRHSMQSALERNSSTIPYDRGFNSASTVRLAYVCRSVARRSGNVGTFDFRVGWAWRTFDKPSRHNDERVVCGGARALLVGGYRASGALRHGVWSSNDLLTIGRRQCATVPLLFRWRLS